MTKPCRAPDPNTRTPAFTLPKNATDAHCHIFGPAHQYPFAPDRTYTPPDAGLDKFKQLQGILVLTRAVLVNASCHGVNNDPIIVKKIFQAENSANTDVRILQGLG